jgi:hypothetical protein
MARNLIHVWLWILALILFSPQPSLAIITHGPPEGLYVHQLAHLLFAGAMIFMIYLVKREGILVVSEFRMIVWASLLFVLWNLDAIVGHIAEVFLSPHAFLGEPTDFSQRLLMASLSEWVYYITKMDHLILVPAFYLLYRGLKALTLKAPGGQGG